MDNYFVLFSTMKDIEADELFESIKEFMTDSEKRSLEKFENRYCNISNKEIKEKINEIDAKISHLTEIKSRAINNCERLRKEIQKYENELRLKKMNYESIATRFSNSVKTFYGVKGLENSRAKAILFEKLLSNEELLEQYKKLNNGEKYSISSVSIPKEEFEQMDCNLNSLAGEIQILEKIRNNAIIALEKSKDLLTETVNEIKELVSNKYDLESDKGPIITSKSTYNRSKYDMFIGAGYADDFDSEMEYICRNGFIGGCRL